MRQTLLGLLALTLALWTASASSQAQAPAKRITFDDHVLPVLKDKCVACHNQDKKRGGLILNNFTRLMEGGSSGACVKPGDPDGSLLFAVMAHTREPFMPPSQPKLGKETLDVIHQWIAGGAPENSGSKVVVTPKPGSDFTLAKVGKGKPEGPPPMPPGGLRLDPVVRAPRGTAVTALAASPWAPLVAVGGHRQVLLYNSDSLELLGVLPFPEGVPQVLKFSRNGSLLLAGGGQAGKSGRVVVWSVGKGERLFEVGEESDCVLAADISADQSRVALGGPGKVVRIYSTRDGKLLNEIRKHTDWVTALEFSPDGVLLATGDRSSGLYVWEAFTGREYYTLKGHTAAITEVSWRADSNVLASASEDTTVRLFEMENGNQIRTWGAHGGGTLSVRYAMDGRILSAGRDKTVKMWDGNGGAQRTFEALPDVATRTAFTHDGARAVAGDWTGAMPVWATADGKRLGSLTANPPTVAEQLAVAEQELAARQKEFDAASALLAVTRPALQKSLADLAAAQKLVADTGAAQKVAEAQLNQARDVATRGKGVLLTAQSEFRAKGLFAQAQLEAATKVRTESEKAKDDRALQVAAARAMTLAEAADLESKAAQRTLLDLEAASRTLDQGLAVAQTNYNAAAAAAMAAPKNVPALDAAVKAVQAKMAGEQAALDRATAELNRVRLVVARWKAAQAAVVVAPKK